MLLMLFGRNTIFGGKMGAKGPGTSGLNQKVGPVGGPFGSTVISKICFRNFRELFLSKITAADTTIRGINKCSYLRRV